MRKAILTLCIAMSLIGAAPAESNNVSSLVGPSRQNLESDLQQAGLVGTSSQGPIELEATTARPQLVDDDFVIRSRPQRLEEFQPILPDRSRPYILDPYNRADLISI